MHTNTKIHTEKIWLECEVQQKEESFGFRKTWIQILNLPFAKRGKGIQPVCVKLEHFNV